MFLFFYSNNMYKIYFNERIYLLCVNQSSTRQIENLWNSKSNDKHIRPVQAHFAILHLWYISRNFYLYFETKSTNLIISLIFPMYLHSNLECNLFNYSGDFESNNCNRYNKFDWRQTYGAVSTWAFQHLDKTRLIEKKEKMHIL